MLTLRRPPLLLTVAAALLMALTLRLAFWQFDRAEQKLALETAARHAMTAAPVTLHQPQAVTPFQRAALVGTYLPQHNLLLDNRVRNRRAGYHVLTPFQLTGGGVVLVKRGWLGGDGSRRVPAIPPPPAGQVTVHGVFTADEADAFRLSDAAESGVVRQHIDLRAFAAESGLPLLPLLLLRDAQDNAALPAVTLRTDYKSAQSVSYAWQWLTFCLLTAVFYVLLAFRK